MPFTVVILISECCPSWERTLLACPGIAGYQLSSTGVTHDIVFDDVHKCQPFQQPAPATTLLERLKNKFNVAQGLLGFG